MTNKSGNANPLDSLWEAPVLIWLLVAGEGLAVVLSLAPGVGGDRLTYFGLTSLVIQWISLLALGGLYLLRKSISQLAPQYIAYLWLTLLVISTWVVCSGVWIFAGEFWSLTGSEWRSLIFRLTGIALTVGLLALAAFQNHWRARLLAVRAKQSELEALQARIRPHFLFNTLNTGAALVHLRPEAAEQLLLDLADLFRAALAGPREIPLEEELSLARRYLEIEALRFGDRLKVEWQLPAELTMVTVPTLSIQPLVENAIRHGVEPSPSGGRIEIKVTEEHGTTCVRVRNSLPTGGIAVTNGHNGHKVGLRSARARIQALTHGRGSVETSIDGDTYTTLLTIPRVRQE